MSIISPHANNVSLRLLFSMLVIILCLLLISIPLMVICYRDYQHNNQNLAALQLLQALSDTANKISRERAPANQLMAGSPAEFAANQQALHHYRQSVDQQIAQSLSLLRQSGHYLLADQLQQHTIPDLQYARKLVDEYARQPGNQRNLRDMEDAITAMFAAWDSHCVTLRQFVSLTHDRQHTDSDFTQILLLADLRDQAGRVVSHIIAPLSLNQPLQEIHRERSRSAQRRTLYLWELVNTLQPQTTQTARYHLLHQQVEQRFIGQGIPLVNLLIAQGQSAPHQYMLNGSQLTQRMAGALTPLVELQSYIIQHSVMLAHNQQRRAQLLFFLTVAACVLSLSAAVFTMIYAQKRVFTPLFQARDALLALSDAPNSQPLLLAQEIQQQHDFFSLSEAIHKLQSMLQQRDILEHQLKHIANSDALTGVGNRLALEGYLATLAATPQRLQQISLLVIDIDNFKQINDQLGHIAGDYMIIYLADQLKALVRTTDFIVRYGGDEFLILLEHMNLDNTLRLAEKIRTAVANTRVTIPDCAEQVTISISIGIACGASSWLELLAQADKSLLKAKALGKNNIQH